MSDDLELGDWKMPQAPIESADRRALRALANALDEAEVAYEEWKAAKAALSNPDPAEALAAALRHIDSIGVAHIKGAMGEAQAVARAALRTYEDSKK